MNRSFNLYLSLFVLLTTPLAFGQAGDGKGNGGGAIVCVDGDGNIKSATLLDLREGVKKHHLNIPRNDTESRVVQLDRALNKLATLYPDRAKRMREVLPDLDISRIPGFKLEYLPRGKRLPPPGDTNLKELDEPRNCSLESVGSFDDTQGTLTIDLEIFEKMSATDQAALFFHEGLYLIERLGPARVRNSEAARKLTAASFSTQPYAFVPANEGLLSAKSVCVSKNQKFEFYVIPLNESSIRLQFTRIDGIDMVEQTLYDSTAEDEIFSKLAQGLVNTVRPVRESDHLPAYTKQSGFQRWAKGPANWAKPYQTTFAAASTYDAKYAIRLKAVDQLVPVSNLVVKPYAFSENAYVTIELRSGFAEISCQALKP